MGYTPPRLQANNDNLPTPITSNTQHKQILLQVLATVWQVFCNTFGMNLLLALNIMLHNNNLFSCVLQVESNFQHTAISSTSDYGIGQINKIAHPHYDFKRMVADRQYSINSARQVFDDTYKRTKGGPNWICAYNVGVRAWRLNSKPTACKAYVTKINKCLSDNVNIK